MNVTPDDRVALLLVAIHYAALARNVSVVNTLQLRDDVPSITIMSLTGGGDIICFWNAGEFFSARGFHQIQKEDGEDWARYVAPDKPE